jgi:hypothetical protein
LNVDAEGKPVEKKKRARQLNDQKGNSIADIADVLSRLGKQEAVKGEERVGEGRRIGLKGEGEGVTVDVRWVDHTDAGFAREWSSNVVHSRLEALTNNRVVGALWGSKKVAAEAKAAARAEVLENSAAKLEKSLMTKEERRALVIQQRKTNKATQKKDAFEKKRTAVLQEQKKKRGLYKLRVMKQALAQGMSKAEANKLHKTVMKPIPAVAEA